MTLQPAPAFTLPDLQGRLYASHEFLDRLVVLNFWSAECPWSRRVDEALSNLAPAWGDRVHWISIAPNANESLESIRDEAARRGLPLVLLDSQRDVAALYGAETTPHLFVIDPAGILRYQGAFDDVTFRQRSPTRSYLQEAVDALLAGGSPPVTSTPPYGCSIVTYSQL